MNLLGRDIRKALGLLAICTFVWTALSCRKEESLKVPTKAPEVMLPTDVKVEISVSHPDDRFRTRSGYLLDRTEGEGDVRTIMVFIVDYVDGKEVYPVTSYASLSPNTVRDWLDNSVTDKIQIGMSTTTGTKHIYVGANMSEAHIRAFVEGRAFKASGLGDAVREVMTIDAENPHGGTGTGILMFAPVFDKYGARDFNITLENPDVEGGEAKLERLVSKVLMTATESSEGYATVAVNGSPSSGFVRLKDIRYMLMNTNRSLSWPLPSNIHTPSGTYQNNVGCWKPEDGSMDPYNFYMDPNFSFSALIDSNGEPRPESLPLFDTHSFEELLKPEAELTIPTVIGYDGSRLDSSTAAGHYVEGIYCLENTVRDDVPASFWTSSRTKDKSAGFVSTFIQIALKFTPAEIYDGNGTDAAVLTTLTEQQAEELLAAQADPSGSVYPAGTFWVRKNGSSYEFYTLNGMRSKLKTDSSLTTDSFIIYSGGWCYYTSFIDGAYPDGKYTAGGSNNRLTYGGQNEWGVRRNHYYILNIERIAMLGSSEPKTMPMEVNSLTTKWRPRGSNTVEIRPN